ncbi:MAG TPA: hypothetical protein VEJ67_18455 [Candidatus Cybelea sp.]|nr:hypothetical protein [Candidatus Cybelea sp.]
MSTWNWIGLGIVLTGAFTAAIFGFRSFERRGDLAETLEWMDQTYNPHDKPAIGGHGLEVRFRRDTENPIEETFQTTFSHDGNCNVVIHNNEVIYADTSNTTTYTFSLRDIDPESIKITKIYSEEVGALRFEARNGASAIVEDSVMTFMKLQGKDREGRSTSKTSHAWFIINDADYAKRFAKAFKHAVELCGGQPSKF